MIIRIVRMTFQEEKVEEFLELFDTYKSAIRHQPGCLHLELLVDHHQSNVFSTYSHWNNENSLNAYRDSDTFGKVWPATKKLFADKPTAHSYQLKMTIE